jgi:hypothetical protein
MYGIQNESINEALEQQSELYGFDMEATAAEHGARVAEATYQPNEVGGVEDE